MDVAVQTAPLEAARRPSGLNLAQSRATSAVGSLAVSSASLLLLALGGIGAAAGATHLRLIALIAFCFLGLGSSVCAPVVRLTIAQRVTIAFVAGFGTLVLVSTVMVNVRWWEPIGSFLVVAGIAVVLHAVGMMRAAATLSADGHGPAALARGALATLRENAGRKDLLVVLLALAGFGISLAVAINAARIDPGVGGFPATINKLWFVGLALAVVAFLLARGRCEPAMALSVVAVALILTITPAIVYGLPRSQSAAKHVDLLRQIRSYHELTSDTAVYNGWPGFFSSTAWLSDIGNIKNPLGLATWWPPIMAVFRVAGLRFLAGRFITNRYECWLVALFGVLLDPLGFDYFSPQSVGLIFGIGIYALALWRRHTLLRMALILTGGVAVSVAHQLSPFIIAAVLVVLVVLRQTRPWWMPALVIVPAAVWTAFHSKALQNHISFASIGHAQNFTPPQTGTAAGLTRNPIIKDTVIAMVISIVVIALFGLYRWARNIRSRTTWALLINAGTGLFFVAINSYGNEAIFRAVIFGLPWIALLGVPQLATFYRRRPVGTTLVSAMAALLTASYVVSTFGLDSINVIHKGDVAAYRYYRLQPTIGTGSSYLLNVGSGDLPDFVPRAQNKHILIALDSLQPADPTKVIDFPAMTGPQEEARLTSALVEYVGGDVDNNPLYTLWSPNSSRFGVLYGTDTKERFAALRDAFIASPDWTVAFTEDGTYVFRYVG